MATTNAQRVGIWIIAIVLTVGTIGGFLAMVLAPQNEAADTAKQQAEYKKMMQEYQEEQRKTSEPLDGYAAESFDAGSVNELKVETLVEGSGEQLTADSTISANYFGWTSDGKIFDSSKKSGTATPIEFSLNGVIPGWTEGLTGVKVGSTVKLTIPAEKAYGSTDDGSGRPVGPLQFIVEVKEKKSIMDTPSIRDVIMIGAGPSALAASVYTTREDIDTVLYEKGVIGGMAAITDQVDNYPGFPEGIEGMRLASQLQAQAERFGAQIELGEVSEIREEDGVKVVVVDGVEQRAKAVLIATGSDYKKVGVPGEAEYFGRGVHYCATCDGAFYRDKKLAVIGGGNSALQETIFLTRFASHIDLIVRSKISASDVLVKELQKYVDSGVVTVHLATTTQEIVATDKKVTAVRVVEAGNETTIDVDGVFVFVGLLPNTGFLKDSPIALDEYGLIKTDTTLQTSMQGVFASGDVRSGATLQIASAVGEGATAALSIREYLDGLNHHAANN